MRVIAYVGVSGAGKSTLIAKDFLGGKMKGENIAIVPDVVHFTRVETPKSNLFDGGAFEEYAYFYLFLDRYTHVMNCLHIMGETGEHKTIFIDETPLTEYVVAKIRGARPKYLKVMEDLLVLLFEKIDEVVYVKPTWKKYKHAHLDRKEEMFKEADNELRDFLDQHSIAHRVRSVA